MTCYITVQLTVAEAVFLLTMAQSSDYQQAEANGPEEEVIRLASNRAEAKIRRALADLERRPEPAPATP